jgi:hypothetical protein
MTEKTHLKNHHSFVDMVSTHVDVWRNQLDRAAKYAAEPGSQAFYKGELAALDAIEAVVKVRDYQRTPAEQIAFIEQIEAHAPVWQNRLSASAFSADADDRSYYEHELRALADIRAAAAVEKALAIDAQRSLEVIDLADHTTIEQRDGAWVLVIEGASARPLSKVEEHLALELLDLRRSALAVEQPRAEVLREQHGNWGEHEDFPVNDWREEVQNLHTRRGYWEWVAAELEARANEAAPAADDEGPQP